MKKSAYIIAGVLIVAAAVWIGRESTQKSEEENGSENVGHASGLSNVPQASSLPSADGGRQDGGDTIGQTGKSAPQELSDAVKALIGEDGKVHNYSTLLAEINKLSYEVSPDDLTALMDMLNFPNDQFPEGMRPIEINAVKNDVLDKLLRQTVLPEGLGLHMAAMAGDVNQDPVWRDYCVQFMQPFYERAAGDLTAKERRERKENSPVNLKLSMNQNSLSNEYSDMLEGLRGLTIAVVYAFEGEDAKGFGHYDIWRMDVVGDWLRAIEEIGAIPYIMDVRTFGQKILNKTQPHIDYVVNLNAGNMDLSTLSLVPSICAFQGITCLPCDAFISVVGENKQFSNVIAADAGLRIPSSSVDTGKGVIKKPTSLGSSIGIEKCSRVIPSTQKQFCQEFIEGFDLSTPVLFHPFRKELAASQSIVYLPDPFDPKWFLSAQQKSGVSNYRKINVQASDDAKTSFIKLAEKFGIQSFCRIDTRVKCSSKEELAELLSSEIPEELIYFIEINPMPTIRANINFCDAIIGNTDTNDFSAPLFKYNNIISKPSVVGFILSCAILGQMKN